ncbi:ferritin-like domain-containing protein [Occallatibacter riparius]|uniref:Ferritin-like protein n=1 Tax=Occallatibacter riparius TaxID=1002689 RepID=A0A9J7BTR2_9BACT|nr:ferritin-like protein [Occallatibacter riparius]UWZ84381.1 ferritin-like protein [Occallatibacter riparius]
MGKPGSSALLISAAPSPAKMQMPSRLGRTINSLDGLREHLQWAIELEHSTIPPYLCALYSIEAGHNSEAAEVLSSVLVEEMLHLALAANLLNAVGGQPRLVIPEMLPGYPRYLPHGDRSFEISLLRFSPEAVETFLKIEQPSPAGAPPEDDNYQTITQFYGAIKRGICDLSSSLSESTVFCGNPIRQITDQHLYSGGGRIIEVRDLSSALLALDEIVEQGEGANHDQVWDGDRDVFHPDRDQVAHYYRFQELRLGRRYQRGDTPKSGPTGNPITVDWNAVRPMSANPRIANHVAGSPIRIAQEQYRLTYCTLLRDLEDAFSGAPQNLGAAIGGMYILKAQAERLMQMPIEDGTATAGPAFEYVDLHRGSV